MNDKTEKKYLADKRRKYYGGTKNDTLYLFRQSQQLTIPKVSKRTLFKNKSRTITDPAFFRPSLLMPISSHMLLLS